MRSVMYQRMYSLSCAVRASLFLEADPMEAFLLEVPEEVLHHCVVVTVALAGHRLDRSGVLQQHPPGQALVLETLIRTNERLLPRLESG